ncbi:MAG: rhomboid family intramembrane serine protease, partial [Acidimicrobiia bacterium]
MIPLKDANPTYRTPIVTLGIIVACLVVFFIWQPRLGSSQPVDVETQAGTLRFDQTTAFDYQYAAIPCELIQAQPLSVDEVVATLGNQSPGASTDRCGAGSATSPEVFPHKNVWLAVVVSMFLHGGLLHLGGNLLFLWVFGNNIEDHLGHIRFAIFYLLGGLVAAGAHILANADSTVPIVGASGAIAAVMGAYLVWFPNAPVRTAVFVFFIFLVDIRAKWLLAFWFVSQFFTDPNSGIAWAAHVGGFVFGVVVGLAIRMSGGLRKTLFVRGRGGRW